jgi:hypothetical protein
MDKKDLPMNDLINAVNGVLEWHDENLSDSVNREYSIKVLRDALQSFQQSVQSDVATPSAQCGCLAYEGTGKLCGYCNRPPRR